MGYILMPFCKQNILLVQEGVNIPYQNKQYTWHQFHYTQVISSTRKPLAETKWYILRLQTTTQTEHVLGNVLDHTHAHTHTHTWTHSHDDCVSHFVHKRLNLEQPCGVPVVRWPMKHLHLTSTAPCINYYTIVVAANVCVFREREACSLNHSKS